MSVPKKITIQSIIYAIPTHGVSNNLDTYCALPAHPSLMLCLTLRNHLSVFSRNSTARVDSEVRVAADGAGIWGYVGKWFFLPPSSLRPRFLRCHSPFASYAPHALLLVHLIYTYPFAGPIHCYLTNLGLWLPYKQNMLTDFPLTARCPHNRHCRPLHFAGQSLA